MRRFYIIILNALVLLLLAANSFGLNESDNIKEFESESSIIPPLPPGEDVDRFEVNFLLKKTSDETVSNAHAFIILKNKDTQEAVSNLQFVQEGLVSLHLKPGRWIGTLGIDEASTLGSDYFANIDVKVTEAETFTPALVPVGSLIGEVYDSDNRVVIKAKVRLECRQYIPSDIATDEFGIFFAEYLAPGECRVAAMQGKKIGFSTVTIEAGKVTNLMLIMDKEVVGNNKSFLAITAVLMILLVIMYAKIRSKIPEGKEGHTKQTEKSTKRRKKQTKVEITSRKKEEGYFNSARVNDILKTLKEREKAVIEYLLENKFESTQAKILYATNIPKTSLMRVFDVLAARNIVEVKKIGKAKKIRLTDWLLGKEEEQK